MPDPHEAITVTAPRSSVVYVGQTVRIAWILRATPEAGPGADAVSIELYERRDETSVLLERITPRVEGGDLRWLISDAFPDVGQAFIYVRSCANPGLGGYSSVFRIAQQRELHNGISRCGPCWTKLGRPREAEIEHRGALSTAQAHLPIARAGGALCPGVFYFSAHVAYFEAHVLESDGGRITVGISSRLFPLRNCDGGCEPVSVGYHSDTGNVMYSGAREPEWIGAPFGSGDVVGCAVHLRRSVVAFTRNGAIVAACTLNCDLHDMPELLPTITAAGSTRVRCNFGTRDFAVGNDTLSKFQETLDMPEMRLENVPVSLGLKRSADVPSLWCNECERQCPSNKSYRCSCGHYKSTHSPAPPCAPPAAVGKGEEAGEPAKEESPDAGASAPVSAAAWGATGIYTKGVQTELRDRMLARAQERDEEEEESVPEAAPEELKEEPPEVREEPPQGREEPPQGREEPKPMPAMQRIVSTASTASSNVSTPRGLDLSPSTLVEEWTEAEVLVWLCDALGMGQYAEGFSALGIDGTMLVEVEESDLQEDLGVGVRLHRKKILKAVAKLKERDAAARARTPPPRHPAMKLQSSEDDNSSAGQHYVDGAALQDDGGLHPEEIVRQFPSIKIIRFEEMDILEYLGRGSSGRVFKVRYRGSLAAAKMMPNVELEQLCREAQMLERVSGHPNVVHFFGACVVPPNLCLVTEFVALGSLEHLVLKGKEDLPLNELLRLAKEAAAGVLHLHCEHIIHRDIAMRNVLVDETFHAKVCDFGLSRFKTTTSEYSQTFSLGGPLRSMPPESIRPSGGKAKFSPKSDVFMFGMLLTELLLREKPYPNMAPHEVAIAVATEGLRPTFTPELRASCGEVLEFLESCLLDRPEARPSMSEVVTWLETYLVRHMSSPC